jgi:hypothetical protein
MTKKQFIKNDGNTKAVSKHIFIEKRNKAAYQNENHYLCFLNYESSQALKRKQSVLLCLTEVHVHSRLWINEQSFVSVYCFHKATYRN